MNVKKLMILAFLIWLRIFINHEPQTMFGILSKHKNFTYSHIFENRATRKLNNK